MVKFLVCAVLATIDGLDETAEGNKQQYYQDYYFFMPFF
jgi:hypothetical protein